MARRFVEKIAYKLAWKKAQDRSKLYNEAEDLAKLRTINRKLQRYHVEYINPDPNIKDWDRWREELDRKVKRLVEKAEQIAKKHKWAIRYQSDPRGSPLKLNLNGKKDGLDFGNDTDLII